MDHGKQRSADIGRAAEDRALSLLQEAGLVLLDRNFRCRLGEIDLVMRDGNAVVFVEVRHRRSTRFGTAAESVGSAKLRRVAAAAEFWLRRARSTARARLDVVTLDGESPRTARMDWIRGVAL